MARMHPDSISLEIAVAHVRAEDRPLLDKLWPQLDEQGVSIERRRMLDKNGLRCGVASQQLPAEFRQLVASDVERDMPALSSHQQIQIGFGESHVIEMAPLVPQLQWSVIQADGSSRTGQCADAAFLFELRTYPIGNGTAEIELCPKIRHGSARPTLTAERDTFVLQPLLEQVSLNEIAVGCRLKPGETLIVGPSAGAGIGGAIFGDPGGENAPLRLLLVRLAQTQMDDLFAPRRYQEPLTTATN
jgi:hypothetical protein